MARHSKQATLACCWGMYGVHVSEGCCSNMEPYYPPSPVTYSSSAPSLSEVLPIVACKRKARQMSSVAEHKTGIESSPSPSAGACEEELEIDRPVEHETLIVSLPSAKACEDELEIDGSDAALQPSGLQDQEEMLGWVSSALVSSVKTAILHLLNTTLRKYLEEICNGCIISQPSQCQHRCLMVKEEEYFFRDNFTNILQRLLTPQFVPAVQRLLRSHNIQADDDGVETIALTLLHELKSEKDIHVTIYDLYESISNYQVAKLNFVDKC